MLDADICTKIKSGNGLSNHLFFHVRQVVGKTRGPEASNIRRLNVVASRLQSPDWTFLSNHSHVLYCISLRPDIRIRDIADKVQITERAVQRIVVDLEAGGYLKRERVGRQNHYRLKPGLPLRHPLEDHVQVGRLLAVLQPVWEMPLRNPPEAGGTETRGITQAKLRQSQRRTKTDNVLAKKSNRFA